MNMLEKMRYESADYYRPDWDEIEIEELLEELELEQLLEAYEDTI